MLEYLGYIMNKIENTYTCTYVTIIIRGEAIIWEEWEAWVGLPGEGGDDANTQCRILKRIKKLN